MKRSSVILFLILLSTAAPRLHAQHGFGILQIGDPVSVVPFSCSDSPCFGTYLGTETRVAYHEGRITCVDAIYSYRPSYEGEPPKMTLAKALRLFSLTSSGETPKLMTSVQRNGKGRHLTIVQTGVVDTTNDIFYYVGDLHNDSAVTDVMFLRGGLTKTQSPDQMDIFEPLLEKLIAVAKMVPLSDLEQESSLEAAIARRQNGAIATPTERAESAAPPPAPLPTPEAPVRSAAPVSTARVVPATLSGSSASAPIGGPADATTRSHRVALFVDIGRTMGSLHFASSLNPGPAKEAERIAEDLAELGAPTDLWVMSKEVESQMSHPVAERDDRREKALDDALQKYFDQESASLLYEVGDLESSLAYYQRFLEGGPEKVVERLSPPLLEEIDTVVFQCSLTRANALDSCSPQGVTSLKAIRAIVGKGNAATSEDRARLDTAFDNFLDAF